MRLVLLAGSVSLVFIAASMACSSSAPATEPADAGRDAKKPVEETPPAEEPVTETPDAGTTEDLDAGTDPDANPTGNTGDAGASCLAESLREQEPNDTEAAGTPLTVAEGPTVSFCGTTTQDQPDFFKFTTPNFERYCLALATSQGGQITGRAKNGNDPEFTFTSGGSFPNITPGAPFVIRVTTNSASAVSYRIKMKFSPNENEQCNANF